MDRTLVQIRERSLVDVLDLAVVVVRDRPATLALAAAMGIGPFVALNAWLFRSATDLAWGIPLVLWTLEAPIATAPLTVVLGGLMFGRRPTVGRVVVTVLRSAVALIVVHGLIRIALFFLIPSRLAFANEIILLERGGWWKVLRRGGDLGSGRAGGLFLMGVFQVALAIGFATLSYVGTGRLGQAVMAEDLTWDTPAASALAGLRFQLPIWLVVAFFAVVRFLTYIDQRIRLEGWEVELRLRAVGEAMEAARRW